MKKLHWKVCGMREPDNILAVAALHPDYLGLIFYNKSPRNASEYALEETLKMIPAVIKRTGVFVNAPLQEVIGYQEKLGLQAVQLHGEESPQYCHLLRERGLVVIKAFSVGEEMDFRNVEAYAPVIDLALFDTATAQRGGSGKRFDWQVLEGYSQQVPFFLSGGIDAEALAGLEALQGMNLYGIDVNSRIESAPGRKDIEQVKEIQQFVNRYNEAYV